MDHFKGFSPAVLRMLDMAPEDGVKLWDLVDMELQPNLIRDRAVLIGDAAHPFMPCMSSAAPFPSLPNPYNVGTYPLPSRSDFSLEHLQIWARERRRPSRTAARWAWCCRSGHPPTRFPSASSSGSV